MLSNAKRIAELFKNPSNLDVKAVEETDLSEFREITGSEEDAVSGNMFVYDQALHTWIIGNWESK